MCNSISHVTSLLYLGPDHTLRGPVYNNIGIVTKTVAELEAAFHKLDAFAGPLTQQVELKLSHLREQVDLARVVVGGVAHRHGVKKP